MADNKATEEIITVLEDTKAAETPKKVKKTKLEDIDRSNIIPENPETKRAMRLRTPTKRFLDEQSSQELDIAIPKGKGMILSNIHNVNIKIHEIKKEDPLLMSFFELIFGKTKKKVDVQKHILQFSGLQYHDPEKDKQQVKEKLEKWNNQDIINLMNLLDLNSKSDNQSELIEQLITFLENPQDSDNPKILKEVTPARKRITKKRAAAETKPEEEEKELPAKRKHDEINVEDTSVITKKEEEEPKKEEEQMKKDVVTDTGATTIPITSTTSTDESATVAPMKESEGQLETKETEKKKPEEDFKKLESPKKDETPEPPLKRQKVENEQNAVAPVEPEKMEIEVTTTNETKVEKPIDSTTTTS